MTRVRIMRPMLRVLREWKVSMTKFVYGSCNDKMPENLSLIVFQDKLKCSTAALVHEGLSPDHLQ
jgi:hypothetical protein